MSVWSDKGLTKKFKTLSYEKKTINVVDYDVATVGIDGGSRSVVTYLP